jgi:hypothetical protein
MLPPTFNIGDVVMYVGKGRWPERKMIISEVKYNTGEILYGTDYGAWFHEADFNLIRKADKKSIKQLTDLLEYE